MKGNDVPDILARIVDATRSRLAASPAKRETLVRQAKARAGAAPFRFREALKGGRTEGVRVIAEIKSASPSAGAIVRDPDIAAIASSYREGGAAAISVVAEEQFFKGSRGWLEAAATASGLPVIMKDFIIDADQIFDGIACGADAILLLASLLDAHQIREFIDILTDHGRDALVEVHDEEELDRALEARAGLIGVNNRNLHDFSVDLSTSERLGRMIPDSVIRAAESGITGHADIVRLRQAGFDAFLVGESLLRQKDHAEAVRRLVRAEQ